MNPRDDNEPIIMTRSTLLLFPPVVILTLAGCPQQQSITGGAVTAVIGISASTGPAPLTVALSAADSSSRNAGELTYAWDLGDGTTSTLESLQHTYANPGLYIVKLTVTDAEGASARTSQDVRVQGGDVIAVIATDVDEGPRPLVVNFDATQSIVNDDVIRDYFWDFGDGTSSFDAQPRHTYTADGEYRVELTVTTAGGVSASTFTTIDVGEVNTSLQFDGNSFVTLPLNNPPTIETLTLEGWFKVSSGGGIAVTLGQLGNSIILEFDTGASEIQAVYPGGDHNATVNNIVGSWQHVAFVFDGTTADPNDPNSGSSSAGSSSLYLNGNLIATGSASGSLAYDTLFAGNTFVGQIAELRLWSTVRSQAAIQAARTQRVSTPQQGLLGAWPFDEGRGQSLDNQAGGADGTLGGSTSAEDSDPTWASDAPPI